MVEGWAFVLLCFFPPECGGQFSCVAFTTGLLSLDSFIPDA